MRRFVVTLSFVILVLFALPVFAGEWVQEGANWKYQDNNGEFITSNHKLIDGKWFLFDGNGHMVTGFYEFNDKFYWYNADGTPNEGAVNYNGRKYNISGKGEVKGVTQEEFYALQDAFMTNQVLNSGTSNQQAATPDAGVTNAGSDDASNYFNTLPLSKRAFKVIFKQKGLNDESINHVLNFSNLNWKEQALKVAKEYYDKSQLDREGMKTLLTDEGFSEAEVSYGTEMAFKNDTLSSGVGKISLSKLEKDYLDKMSLSILGRTISDISAEKKEAEKAAKVAESAAAVDPNAYTIKNTVKKTLQLNLADDDAAGGSVKIKMTLPIPVLEGPRAAELNPIIDDKIFGEAEKYLEYNYYEVIRRDKKYSASSVKISSQDASEIKLYFAGSVPVELVIDLNTMSFKRDMIKP